MMVSPARMPSLSKSWASCFRENKGSPFHLRNVERRPQSFSLLVAGHLLDGESSLRLGNELRSGWQSMRRRPLLGILAI